MKSDNTDYECCTPPDRRLGARPGCRRHAPSSRAMISIDTRMANGWTPARSHRIAPVGVRLSSWPTARSRQVREIAESLPADAPQGSTSRRPAISTAPISTQTRSSKRALRLRCPGLQAIAAARTHEQLAELMGRPDSESQSATGRGDHHRSEESRSLHCGRSCKVGSACRIGTTT